MKRSSSKLVRTLVVYLGREPIGCIVENEDGSHEAVNANGEFIGSYRSRQ